MPASLPLGCFPMLPWINRLDAGGFEFDGRAYVQPRNCNDPHPLHGEGWTSAWDGEPASAHEAWLRMRGGATAAWPWRYEAWQRFALTPRALTVNLGLRNLADRPAPAALGLHPFFPGRSTAWLEAGCSGVWTRDDPGMPKSRRPAAGEFDLRGPQTAVGALNLDHCFDGWNGTARIGATTAPTGATGRARFGLSIEALQCRWLQVFAPPHGDVFCVEPQTTRPDALNPRPDDPTDPVQRLAPGETLEIEVRFAIEA
jgi:aldose 1-epimerase